MPASDHPVRERLGEQSCDQGRTMKSTFVIALVLALCVGGSTAQARSCTEQSSVCKSWAESNLDASRAADAKKVCASEVPKCIARCKAGEKYFLGIGGSTQYPIDACR